VTDSTSSGTDGAESLHTLALPRRTLVVRRWKSTAAVAADAAPAFMVHGLGGNSKNWSYLAPLLADELDTAAIDLPGFGEAPPPRDGDYSPSGHADAVIAAIEECFGGRPVHLFGNSLGGHVSTIVSARRPDLVRTLTLVSPALPSFTPARLSMTVPVTASPVLGARLLKRYAATPAEDRAIGLAKVVLADLDNAPVGWLDMVAEDIRNRDPRPYAQDAYVQSSRNLLRAYLHRGPDDAWNDARRVTAPTLLIFGQRDNLVPVAVARRARAAFANSRLLLLPESGHVAQIEHAQLVAEAWSRFASDMHRGISA
jgi:pimeloyl-ACP methyl ester carboxylesterase